jgi:hypothetical protein
MKSVRSNFGIGTYFNRIAIAALLASIFQVAGCRHTVRLTPTEFTKTEVSTDAARTREEITTMLSSFLTQDVNNSKAGHERFWADDLVYTSSAGAVKSKADILKTFEESPEADKSKEGASSPKEPTSVYTAEEILVRPYGEMAALTFRLVQRNSDGATNYYRNSGTFLLRNGKWQAISWQATKVLTQPK